MRNPEEAMPNKLETTRSRLSGWIAALLGLVPWAAGAAVYSLPTGGDLIGRVEYETARQEDTLIDIARRASVGQIEIDMANPKVDRWLPGAGTQVVIPHQFILPDAPRAGIVVNVPEMRMYYYPVQYGTVTHRKEVPGKADPNPKKGAKAAPPKPTYVTTTEVGEPVSKAAEVITYPVSMGRMDWRTPLGKTRIIQKVKDPTWTPPESIKREHAKKGEILPDVVPAGPNNPLGPFAMKLGVAGYLIHGTDRGDPGKPFGIGMRVTHGCMRMYNEDVTKLYPEVSVGTPVYLVNQPVKLGWQDGELYLEASWPLDEDAGVPTKWGDDFLDESNLSDEEVKAIRVKKRDMLVAHLEKTASKLLEKENAKRPILVDKAAIHEALQNPTGMPVHIGKEAPPPAIEAMPSEPIPSPYGTSPAPAPAPQAAPAPYGSSQYGAGVYHAPRPVTPQPAPPADTPSTGNRYQQRYGQPPAADQTNERPSAAPYGEGEGEGSSGGYPPAGEPYGSSSQPAEPPAAPDSYGSGQPSPGRYPGADPYGQQPPAAATYPYGSSSQATPGRYPPAVDPYGEGQESSPGQYSPEPSQSQAPDPYAPEEEEE
jgi:L,D-transpeptidase ErfK/SrfK